MIIIAFAQSTSKILPRIFCRHFYHCAVIVPRGDELVMYQFMRPGRVTCIYLRDRDIRTLRRHGWRFIYMDGTLPSDYNAARCHTCVGAAKRALRIRAPFIQTPYALYIYLYGHR